MTKEEKEIVIDHLRKASSHMDKARDILSRSASIDFSCSLNLCHGRVNDIIDDIETVIKCRKQQ
jgi:hypothetical protein